MCNTRSFSSLIPNYKTLPGLFIGKDFSSKQEQQRIFNDISELFVMFRKQANETKAVSAEIPQVSKLHNLPSAEAFVALQVSVPGAKEPLKVEYFARYGEDGHELAYIRGRQQGNSNLPPFAWTTAQKIIEAVAKAGGRELKDKYTKASAEGMVWKLTLNYYTCSKQVKGKRAGFPFHTDIQANGDETYILGFGNPAKMEFVPHAKSESAKSEGSESYADQKFESESQRRDDVTTVEVEAGELVGLTGEVRNTWLHRVVPEEETLNDRVSMVLGCRPVN